CTAGECVPYPQAGVEGRDDHAARRRLAQGGARDHDDRGSGTEHRGGYYRVNCGGKFVPCPARTAKDKHTAQKKRDGLMPKFAYEALASSGQRSTGPLTAGSDREVMAMLDARGLFPLHIAPAKAASGGFSFSFGRRVSSKQMTAFYSQLAD